MGFFDFFCKKTKEQKFNEDSSRTLGWSPKMFQADNYGDELTENVKKYQSKVGLEADGKVDTSTYRRRMAEKDAINTAVSAVAGKYIVCNGEIFSIDWDKVVLWKHAKHLEMPKKNYRVWNEPRNVDMFMTHWDVCLSSSRCFDILKRRGLSVHFLIDNDGTIIQTMDTQHAAWHAGNRKINNKSIGVEISNAYYLKYQKTYELKGFGARPIWVNDVEHAKEKGESFLGFYDVQIEALKALIKTLSSAHNIPLVTPATKTIVPSIIRGKYSGIVNHYHASRRKIDCAGLDLEKILKEIVDSE